MDSRYIWPIVCAFLLLASIPACLEVTIADQEPKRVLDAFSSLFNARLTVYLALIPRSVIKDMTRVSRHLYILALSICLTTAVAAVVLAFFDHPVATAASGRIQMLLGPVQNYIVAVVLANHLVNRANGQVEMV